MAEGGRLRVGRLFANLRPRSEFSLEQAVVAAHTEGVAATLVITIPAKTDVPCEMFFTTGPAQLVQDLWKLQAG